MLSLSKHLYFLFKRKVLIKIILTSKGAKA
jgi:hypothetical protein